jgi:hypothetical protein
MQQTLDVSVRRLWRQQFRGIGYNGRWTASVGITIDASVGLRTIFNPLWSTSIDQ